MATRVIEEPTTERVVHEHYGDRSSNSGLIIGLILLLVVVFLFLFYGLPLIRSAASPSINVPKSVDVNVNGTAK